jgi:hypothetical protein
MKKASKKPTTDEIERLPDSALERYDWSRAKRGRYAGKLRMGSAMRRLDDDLAEAFPNSKAVNEALRAVLALGNVLPALARRASKRTAA